MSTNAERYLLTTHAQYVLIYMQEYILLIHVIIYKAGYKHRDMMRASVTRLETKFFESLTSHTATVKTS